MSMAHVSFSVSIKQLRALISVFYFIFIFLVYYNFLYSKDIRLVYGIYYILLVCSMDLGHITCLVFEYFFMNKMFEQVVL